MQESMASAGCSELCRPLCLTTSCFMQKNKLFWNVLRSLCSKPFTLRESKRIWSCRKQTSNHTLYVCRYFEQQLNFMSCQDLKDSNPVIQGRKHSLTDLCRDYIISSSRAFKGCSIVALAVRERELFFLNLKKTW